jgi:DNA-binding IclR family transcriptional regulator
MRDSPPESKSRSTPAKSAFRAMELLEFFAEHRRPASVKEISSSLGYPQSSTSVLLRALAEAGYFDQEPLTGRYLPSVRVLLAVEWIGERLFSAQRLLSLMEAVLDQTGYTVMIGTQHGMHVRYLHVLQSTREGRFIAKTGSLRPLFRTAAGKMLLTLKPEREIALLLRRVNALEKDPALRLPFEDVIAAREAARREGYAISLGTNNPGAAALAVLLPVPRGAEPLTLSVGGPLAEIRRKKMKLLRVLDEAIRQLRSGAGK